MSALISLFFPGYLRRDFSPCATTSKNKKKKNISPPPPPHSPLCGGDGCSQTETIIQSAKINILSDNHERVPGFRSSRAQAAGASGGSARLSRSETPSRSNLPRDPPSKTAALHKKDDTDTRIIFKSCGTARSLRHFQRLAANFLLSVCPRLSQETSTTTGQTRLMRKPRNAGGSQAPGAGLTVCTHETAGEVFVHSKYISPPLK